MSSPSRFGRTLLGLALAALLASAVGCSRPPAPVPQPDPTIGASETPSVEAPPETPEATEPSISQESIDYALSLGGTPHEGATLFLVVGAVTDTEEDARAALDEALPMFGDMQSYFIVQRSDNFTGLDVGPWVVFEAYRDEPSEDNLMFAGRAFRDPSVHEVVVATSDPIPVTEEILESIE